MIIKEGHILKLMIKVIVITTSIAILLLNAGCGDTKQKANQNVNPFNEQVVSMREIQSEQVKYLGKTVVIGPVKVTNNNVAKAQFYVTPSKDIDFTAIDFDINMDVLYKNASEYAKWRDLSSDKRPIIYVRGQVASVQYSNSMRIVASEIKFVSNSKL